MIPSSSKSCCDRMNTPVDGSKRMRVRKACLPCSTRKRKCDGTFPCEACKRYGYECRYRNEPNPLRPDSGRVPSTFQSRYLDGPAADKQPPSQVTTPAGGPEPPEQVNETNHGLLVVSSSKYLGRHSAQAFPRFLGLQMQAQTLPKLQPFAWNMDIRPMAPLKARRALCSLITLYATQTQLSSFFRSKFPVCSFLNLDILAARCEKHWVGHDQGLPFEALICGVIGLASVLSNMIDVRQESDIMEHGEKILNDQTILAEANVEVLAAILLRSLYLRATATPQITWLVSCTAMHMAESLGLHKQYTSNAGRQCTVNTQWNNEVRSYLFWIICAGNRLISHELGRSPVFLHDVTREFPFLPSDSSSAASFCRLCCLLSPGDTNKVSEDDQKRFLDSLEEISNMQYDQPFLNLIAADVCFIMYRRIRVSSHQNMSKQQLQQVVLIGREAVHAADQLLSKGQLWWNLLSTLFQFCCVLISMDSTDSLADLQYAMKTINKIRKQYPGENIAQALSTLKTLIAASKRRKEVETAYLTTAEEAEALPTNIYPEVPFGSSDFAPSDLCFDNVNWAIEDLDWMSAEAPLSQ